MVLLMICSRLLHIANNHFTRPRNAGLFGPCVKGPLAELMEWERNAV